MGVQKNVADAVKTKIEKRGRGATLSYADFRGLPFLAVAKALSRFVKDGWLLRVRKGVYHYPRKTALGHTFPKLMDLLDHTPWSQNLIANGTASSASYNLGLTTQVPMETVLIGDYPNRTIDFAGTKVRTRRRDTAHLKHLDKTEISILAAIRNLNKLPAVEPEDALRSIKKHIFTSDIKALCHAALHEPPRVRAILGAILEERGGHRRCVDLLRRSLNPLTTYKLGFANILPLARDWGIR